MCLLVVLIFAITEFTQGAWVVVVVMPILIYGLMRTNAEYRTEDAILDEGVALRACQAPVLRRHTAIVLVDRIDLATARAIQYARNLNPDELYAVHFNVDNRRAEAVMRRWRDLGLSKLPLEVIEVADRRLGRAALEMAPKAAGWSNRGQRIDPHPQLPPQLGAVVARQKRRQARACTWSRPSCQRHARTVQRGGPGREPAGPGFARAHLAGGATGRWARGSPSSSNSPPWRGPYPIADLRFRRPAKVAGRLRSVRIQPWSDVPSLEGTLIDASGGEVLLVFLGRREIPGIRTGTQLVGTGNGRRPAGPAGHTQP